MKNHILLLLLSGVAFMVLGTGCAKSGCTDPSADNFDPFAERNDGNCIYSGCTDPNASNYNPQANVSNGTCIYPPATGEISFWSSVQCCALEVSFNGQVIDTIDVYYTTNPGCVNGEGIVRVSRVPGDYPISARSITGAQYMWADTITITQNECFTYEFSL